MKKKYFIRKKYYSIRKKKFFKVDKSFFNPLTKIIEKYKYKKKNISLYYPISYELNILNIVNVKFFKNFNYFWIVHDLIIYTRGHIIISQMNSSVLANEIAVDKMGNPLIYFDTASCITSEKVIN